MVFECCIGYSSDEYYLKSVMMLDTNFDTEEGAVDRCTEPPLSILRQHALRQQVESLIKNYDYEGALQIVKKNRNLFSRDTRHLILHGHYRVNLRWGDAKSCISSYKGNVLLGQTDDFMEYFQVMELQQRKGELSNFIVKLSPILTELGCQYVDSLPGFNLKDCGSKTREGTYYVNRKIFFRNFPHIVEFIEGHIMGKTITNGPLYFYMLVNICKYYAETSKRNNEKHQEITEIFQRFRIVEESARNSLAHTVTNMTEGKLIQRQEERIQKNKRNNRNQLALHSKDMVQLLNRLVHLIQHREIKMSYDRLNQCILDSLRASDVADILLSDDYQQVPLETEN